MIVLREIVSFTEGS